MTVLERKIGFIGAGNMAEAMINGMIISGVSKKNQIIASDVSDKRRRYMEERYSIETTNENSRVIAECRTVFLAVKPQQMNSLLSEISAIISSLITEKKIIVSIAAGISLSRIEGYLYSAIEPAQLERLPIIRAMPNTPALVQAGITGLAGNAHATEQDLADIRQMLEGVGKVVFFNETQMDSVTAVSGSGPAYLFYFVEALVDAGISIGLMESDSLLLVTETIKGAMSLLEKTGEQAEGLRKKVTSPGGTTEAACTLLDSHEFKKIIGNAVKAAARRSKELSAAVDLP
ncbi:MAG: pyrroline-5-carboxylate reductase [Pseudomonadota bacterium]